MVDLGLGRLTVSWIGMVRTGPRGVRLDSDTGSQYFGGGSPTSRQLLRLLRQRDTIQAFPCVQPDRSSKSPPFSRRSADLNRPSLFISIQQVRGSSPRQSLSAVPSVLFILQSIHLTCTAAGCTCLLRGFRYNTFAYEQGGER